MRLELQTPRGNASSSWIQGMERIIKIPDQEITPPSVYFNRRLFMRAAVAAGSVTASASLYRWFNPTNAVDSNKGPAVELGQLAASEEELLARGWRVAEEKTTERNILNYNNFYEFTTQKEAVAAAAANFKTDGWKIAIGGLVDKY